MSNSDKIGRKDGDMAHGAPGEPGADAAGWHQNSAVNRYARDEEHRRAECYPALLAALKRLIRRWDTGEAIPPSWFGVEAARQAVGKAAEK